MQSEEGVEEEVNSVFIKLSVGGFLVYRTLMSRSGSPSSDGSKSY